MKNATVPSIVAALLGLMCVSLIVGCATEKEHRSETISEQQFRTLYPRRYLQSLDPYEREYVERRMAEEERRTEREGKGKR